MEINNDLTEWIKGAAERGENFLQAEAPQFVAELLAWEFWSSCLGVALCLFLALAVFAPLVYWSVKNKIPEAFVCFLVLTCLLLVCSVGFTYSAVKVKVAPRLVIVEKVKGLVP